MAQPKKTMTNTATAMEEETRSASNTTSVPTERLSGDELAKMDAYWRACKYLAAGMIYLRANPLLREPLKQELDSTRSMSTSGRRLLSAVCPSSWA
jgi:phosphoketolase